MDLSKNESIEYLYKDVRYPAVEVEKGFGEFGVLIRDTKKDLLQCHECGEWFEYLAQHVHAHGLTAKEYKMKYGFKLNAPLANNRIRKRQSDVAKKIIRKRMSKDKLYIKI